MQTEIINKIQDDIKSAMKAGQKDTVTALRTLMSEIKNVGIYENREVTDTDASTVISKAIKQREDSVEMFRKGNREDLAGRELEHIAIYKKYLPQQLDRTEIERIVDEAIAQCGAASKKDMGAVMKVIMPQVKGKADGKLVNQIVGEKLP